MITDGVPAARRFMPLLEKVFGSVVVTCEPGGSEKPSRPLGLGRGLADFLDAQEDASGRNIRVRWPR